MPPIANSASFESSSSILSQRPSASARKRISNENELGSPPGMPLPRVKNRHLAAARQLQLKSGSRAPGRGLVGFWLFCNIGPYSKDDGRFASEAEKPNDPGMKFRTTPSGAVHAQNSEGLRRPRDLRAATIPLWVPAGPNVL